MFHVVQHRSPSKPLYGVYCNIFTIVVDGPHAKYKTGSSICTVTTVLLILSTSEVSSAREVNVLLKLEITHHGEHKEAL